MSQEKPKILFVLTNHDRLGPLGDESVERTGFHVTEASHPWQTLTAAGFDVRLATPRGGAAPIDPSSLDRHDPINRAFLDDPTVASQLQATPALSTLSLASYAALYFPGGHGTMWDLPDNPDVQRAVRDMYAAGKVIGAVCHGPAALVNVKLADGAWLVAGKRLAAFTDAEEVATGKDGLMPFALATALLARGATHIKRPNFDPCIALDGRLITGQNPASAQGVGEAIRDALRTQ